MTRRADADRLAALLEAERPEVAAAGAPSDDQVLASLASALRDITIEVPPMRAEFRAELRAQVVEAAREQQTAPFLTRVRDRIHQAKHSAGFATGTGIAAMTLSMGGVAGAAELAQPGDLLYGVKLQIEDARLALTFDDVARGQRAVTYAFDRLDEAGRAAGAGEDHEAAVALQGAAGRMAEATDLLVAAGLTEPLLSLSDDVDRQQAVLEVLLPQLEGEGQMAAQELIEQLDDTRDALAQALMPDASSPGSAPAGSDPSSPPPATSTATPVPDVTFPPVGGPTAAPTEAPSAPGATTPTLPIPGPTLPGLPGLPDLPDLPGLPSSDGTSDQPLDQALDGIADPGSSVDAAAPVTGPVQDAVEDVIEGTTDAVGDVVDGLTGGVTEPVEQVLEGITGGTTAPVPPAPPPPAPLPGGAVEQPSGATPGSLTGAVGDTLSAAGSSDVPGALDR